jgi:hypothetical protein
MKTPLILILSAGLLAGCASHVNHRPDTAQQQPPSSQKPCLTKFNQQIIDQHAQRYDASCIPSSVEMVLKLLGREPVTYYELQDDWKNKSDGTFGYFDNRTINGVTFHRQFFLPRNDQFPLPNLFQTIDSELKAGRFVIVSLPSDAGWHMYVIYDEDETGDFKAVSKIQTQTIFTEHVKQIIQAMKGTDIMTYDIGKQPG